MLIKKLQSTSEWFSGENSGRRQSADLFHSVGLKSAVLHQCYWQSSPDCLNLPVLIVPGEGDLETIFADMATYHGSLSPISAYAHVVSGEIISLMGIKGKKYSQSQIAMSPRILGILVSLVFGEAETARCIAGISPDATTYAACRRTFAYALARSSVLYPEINGDIVLAKWFLARRLSRMEFSSASVESVLRIGQYLIRSPELFASQNTIENEALAYIRGEITHHEMVRSFTSEFSNLSDFSPAFDGVFDRRMGAFDLVAKEVLSREDNSSDIGAIVLAFFGNAISPGSYSYFDMLSKFLDRFPSVLLWYSLFSGLSNDVDWRSVGQGLGHKIGRDLVQSFSLEARPLCDISVDELEILSRVSLSQFGVRPTQQKAILVSLLPGVDTYVRFPGAADFSTDASEDRRILEYASRDRQVRKLLGDALNILEAPDSARARRDIDSEKKYKKYGKY